MFERVFIAGYGQMASALLEGWIAAGIAPDRFVVFNPRLKAVPAGVTFTTTVTDDRCDAVMLGFKPHMLTEVAATLNPLVERSRPCVLSLLAGVTADGLEESFPDAGTCIRFMPNLASRLGKSPVALFARQIGTETRAKVTMLADASGEAVWLDDEAQFDLVTALAGSGPAFVYRFIDALAAGAANLGLDRGQAQALALQMVEGAAALAAGSEETPGTLADKVASTGGMTRQGLDVLDHDRALERLLTDCLRETRDRGKELAQEARQRR